MLLVRGRWDLSCCTKDKEYRLMNPCLFLNKRGSLEVVGRMTRSLPPPIVRVENTRWAEFEGYERVDVSLPMDSFIVRKDVQQKTPWVVAQPELRVCTQMDNNGFEDPRTFWYCGELYVIANFRGGEDCAQNLVVYNLEGLPRVMFLHKRNITEKNWTFFEVGDQLMCVYSISPFRVGIMKHNSVELKYESTCPIVGAVGGGATPVYLQQYGVYLGVAHVRREYIKDDHVYHTYRNFFYTFQSAPPYTFLKHHLFHVDKHAHIEFASGLIVIADRLLISIGTDDIRATVIEYSLHQLLHILNHNNINARGGE